VPFSLHAEDGEQPGQQHLRQPQAEDHGAHAAQLGQVELQPEHHGNEVIMGVMLNGGRGEMAAACYL